MYAALRLALLYRYYLRLIQVAQPFRINIRRKFTISLLKMLRQRTIGIAMF